MKLKDLLIEYGRKKGLGKIELEDSGICRVLVNDSSVVTFEMSLDGQGFYIYAIVTSIPPEKERELGIMALKGNLFGRETGQANLGFLPQSRSLVLSHYFEEYSTDYPLFERKFEEFMQYLTYWMNKIEIKETPQWEEISFEKHVFDLPKHKNLKIFFA